MDGDPIKKWNEALEKILSDMKEIREMNQKTLEMLSDVYKNMID
jgi:hypothetical protein